MSEEDAEVELGAADRLFAFLQSTGADKFGERGLELQKDYMDELDKKAAKAIVVSLDPRVKKKLGVETCEDAFNQALSLIRNAAMTISLLSLIHSERESAAQLGAEWVPSIDVEQIQGLITLQQLDTTTIYLRLNKLMQSIAHIMVKEFEANAETDLR